MGLPHSSYALNVSAKFREGIARSPKPVNNFRVLADDTQKEMFAVDMGVATSYGLVTSDVDDAPCIWSIEVGDFSTREKHGHGKYDNHD